MTNSDPDKFVPAFAMPVIAPPPDDYANGTAAYYADVALQSTLGFANVVIPPEAAFDADPQQALLPPAPKGLRITISNPNASLVDGVPFGTLFALTGGWLSYVRATPDVSAGSAVALLTMLPPPFDGVMPAPQYPAPAGLDPIKLWGAYVLRLWGGDFQKLSDALEGSPACGAVYYLGVDETSAKTALEALVKLHFRQDHYDQSVTASTKPVFQSVVEEIKGQAYTTSPASYAMLTTDFLTELLNGNTSLLVKGGSAIGEAVQIPDTASMAATPPPLGLIELWFLENAQPPAFISPSELIRLAPSYDF